MPDFLCCFMQFVKFMQKRENMQIMAFLIKGKQKQNDTIVYSCNLYRMQHMQKKNKTDVSDV